VPVQNDVPLDSSASCASTERCVTRLECQLCQYRTMRHKTRVPAVPVQNDASRDSSASCASTERCVTRLECQLCQYRTMRHKTRVAVSSSCETDTHSSRLTLRNWPVLYRLQVFPRYVSVGRAFQQLLLTRHNKRRYHLSQLTCLSADMGLRVARCIVIR
jgi:hypothetical protein